MMILSYLIQIVGNDISFRASCQRILDFVHLKAQIVTVEKHMSNVAINEDNDYLARTEIRALKLRKNKNVVLSSFMELPHLLINVSKCFCCFVTVAVVVPFPVVLLVQL